MNCIICKKEMGQWLTMPLDPKKNQLSEGASYFKYCSDCSLGSMAPIPQPEIIHKFYDLENYYTQSEGHMPNIKPALLDKVMTKLAYLIDKGKPVNPDSFLKILPAESNVLDVGAGGGVLLLKYKDFGWNTFGLEPDPQAKSHHLSDAIITYQGTAEAIPKELESKKFDLISMTHVLEHCIDPINTLSNIFSLLKPGGTFWCEVPNCGCNHFKKMNVCSEMFDAPRHIHFLDKYSLTKLIESTGFHIEKTYFHGFCRHHSPSWRAWEKTIYQELKKTDPSINTTEHTYWESVRLLASNVFSPPEKKYDCVGVIAKRLQ